MKILYMSKSPLAGVCEKMTQVVNKYLGPDHEARACNGGPARHRWYCRDQDLVPSYSINDPKHVKECIEWADVVHCMANVGIRSKYFDPFSRPRLLDEKRWIFQWHGAQIWDFRTVWIPEDYAKIRFIHIGQGWIQTQRDFFQPFIDEQGLVVVPNVITGDDPLHTPLPWSERINRTAFAPSQRNESAVNKKGIRETMTALRRTKFDLICGASFEECLRRKQRSKLGIDEVVTPMYHLSGLEFLAQGTPCICSYTDETERVLRDATGATSMPFINASVKNLREKIEWYWGLEDSTRESMGKECRAWFDEFYHPKILIEKYLDIYRG